MERLTLPNLDISELHLAMHGVTSRKRDLIESLLKVENRLVVAKQDRDDYNNQMLIWVESQPDADIKAYGKTVDARRQRIRSERPELYVAVETLEFDLRQLAAELNIVECDLKYLHYCLELLKI